MAQKMPDGRTSGDKFRALGGLSSGWSELRCTVDADGIHSRCIYTTSITPLCPAASIVCSSYPRSIKLAATAAASLVSPAACASKVFTPVRLPRHSSISLYLNWTHCQFLITGTLIFFFSSCWFVVPFVLSFRLGLMFASGPFNELPW